ncbi:MAG: hypothetical protein H6839_17070 [Planctomycetes bacterium]|nr:hypothetical protein [Planctomycetota bacterium]
MSTVETQRDSVLVRAASVLRRVFENGYFALFMIAALLLWNGLMLTLTLMPAPDGALGQFTSDFRRWCLNYDEQTGSVDWVYAIPFITVPVVLGGATFAVYYRQLVTAARRPLALFVCVGAALLAVGSAGAGLYWMSDAMTPIAQGQQPDTPLAFPAEQLRVAITPPAFDLLNQDGERVSLDRFRGKVVIMTGVYSTCPHT